MLERLPSSTTHDHSHARGLQDAEENGPNLPPRHSARTLPPYSPMLDCVEHAISAFKAELKRTLEESRPALLQLTHGERMASLAMQSEMAIRVITVDKCAKWFGKTQTYLEAAMAMEDIIM